MGDDFLCVFLGGVQVKCDGKNTEAQRGLGSTSVPLNMQDVSLGAIASSVSIISIVSGRAHTCVLFKMFRAKCWGANRFGQAGQAVNNAVVGDVVADMGDNLPKGTPVELFDLCNPHPVYNIDKAPQHEKLIECVNSPKANDRPDHYDQTLRQFAKIMLEPPVKL